MKLLVRHYPLGDDVGFRFSDRQATAAEEAMTRCSGRTPCLGTMMVP
jgi:alpha-amylase/alpha-mannosidase (GH57 family)